MFRSFEPMRTFFKFRTDVTDKTVHFPHYFAENLIILKSALFSLEMLLTLLVRVTFFVKNCTSHGQFGTRDDFILFSLKEAQVRKTN